MRPLLNGGTLDGRTVLAWRKAAVALCLALPASCASTIRVYSPATRTFSDRAGVIACPPPTGAGSRTPTDPILSALQANLTSCYSEEENRARSVGTSCVRLTVDQEGSVVQAESSWPFL